MALPRQRYTRTIVWSRESPIWLWAALGALLLVALAAGAIVALAATDDEKDAAPSVSSLAPTTDTVPTVPVDPDDGHAHDSVDPHAPHDDHAADDLDAADDEHAGDDDDVEHDHLLAGRDGRVDGDPALDPDERGPRPRRFGRPAGDQRRPPPGRRAELVGLRQPEPGYYVTFTGVYTSETQAEGALPNARSKGFPTAYVRRVAD